MLLGPALGGVRHPDVDLWMAAKGAPGAAAVLDFAGQKYGFRSPAGVPRWGSVAADMVFARASSAGRWPDSGPYEMVGNGVPRIDHDPLTREPLGVLIERSSINLCQQSEVQNGLAGMSSAINAAAITDFEGGRTGLRLNNAASTATAYKPVTATAGNTYTIACDVEMEDGAPPAFGGAVNSALNTFAFNLGGTFYIPARIAKTGVKVWRCFFSGAFGSTRTDAGIAQYQANEQRRIKVTGFQLEAGAPTSYIIAGASTVTRGTDNLSLLLPVVPADGFTVAFRAHMPRYGNVGDSNTLLTIAPAGTTANSLGLTTYGSIGQIWMGFPGGVGVYRLATAIAPGAEFYGAFAWSAARGWRGTALGGAVVNVTAQPGPVADLARMTLGSRAGAAPWGSTIKRLDFWPHGDFSDDVMRGLLAA